MQPISMKFTGDSNIARTAWEKSDGKWRNGRGRKFDCPRTSRLMVARCQIRLLSLIGRHLWVPNNTLYKHKPRLGVSLYASRDYSRQNNSRWLSLWPNTFLKGKYCDGKNWKDFFKSSNCLITSENTTAREKMWPIVMLFACRDLSFYISLITGIASLFC